MNIKYSILCYLIALLSLEVRPVASDDFFLQSRIKGCMIGGALADALAQATYSENSDVERGSLNGCKRRKCVKDSGGCAIAIGSENSVISFSLLESLTISRAHSKSSSALIKECAHSLENLLKRKRTDPFYADRPFTSEIVADLQRCGNKQLQKNDSLSELPLIRVISVALVFSDDLSKVKKYADSIISLTHTHPTVRAAGVALAVGIASLINNLSLAETIDEMVQAAQVFHMMEMPVKQKAVSYQDLPKKSLTSYVTGDMIEYVARFASTVSFKKMFGNNLSTEKRADEALAMALYTLVRNSDTIKKGFTDALKRQENDSVIPYITGALLGAYKGFGELRKNFENDIPFLEKVNVLQNACNDLYILLCDGKVIETSDEKPALISTRSKKSLKESKQLFSEGSHDDFIIRWGFQELCDHVYDPRISKWVYPSSSNGKGVFFNPDSVKPGDIIFARNIELFMKAVHPSLTAPYILVTHGEFRDTCMEHHLSYLDDPKILAWFSIHPPKNGHEKFFPLPLGIKQEEAYFRKSQEMNSFLKKLRTKAKDKLVYMNISLEQNPERQICYKHLVGKDFCFNRNQQISFEKYLEEMAEYKFAVSPRGWGPDCYRTWEALLVGSIPIVRRSQFDQLITRGCNIVDPGQRCTWTSSNKSQLDLLYDDLPILVIDDWQELTEDFLQRKYKEITSKTYSLEKLYLKYWQKKIIGTKQKYLRSVKEKK